jgi:glycerol-3-phosphate cytidylyltransferase
MEKVKVITFGTYDLLHIGHINLLMRARKLGDYLIVGVSSDKLSVDKKNRQPIYNQTDRMAIINSLKYVDEVFFEHSLELKRYYILHHNASVLVMGDDWTGKFDHLNDICKVIYLPRTACISTTSTIQEIVSNC